MSAPLSWTAQDGTTCHLLVADVKPRSTLTEFWLVTQHPHHRDDAFVRVLTDGTKHATRVRDEWASVYVEAARLALGARLPHPAAPAATTTAA